ncbi:MAG: hypothetical protein GY757_24390 [bacterium]|nr:hypothetical protein [bacterium]
MKAICLLLITLLLLVGCGSDSPKSGEKEVPKETIEIKNVFQDKTLQKIYDMQDHRQHEGLYPYLKDKNPIYREAAALAFASVQNPAAIERLAPLLEDPEINVRVAAAYALGQTGDKAAEPILIKTFEAGAAQGTSKKDNLKPHILQALGKCGTEKGLAFLTNLKIQNDTPLLTGQARGIYRYTLRSIISKEGTGRAVQLMGTGMAEGVRWIASNYLVRTRNIDLKEYALPLLTAFDNETNLFTKLQLARALGKAVTPEVLARLKKTIASDVDYRLKVNALMGLRGFEYGQVRDFLLKQVTDSDVNVSIAAAESLQVLAKKEDAELYFETAKKLGHWRSRTLLLETALTVADKKNKKLRKWLRDYINAAYKKTAHNYEKAWLLTALGASDVEDYMFLQSQLFANKGNVRGTYAMGSLMQMGEAVKDDAKMRGVFLDICKRVIETGDSTTLTMAAGMLRNPAMNFKKDVTGTGFLKEAMKKCKLPADIDMWQELQLTVAFFDGPDKDLKKPVVPKTVIDWSLVETIPADQKIKIKTTQGDIVAALFIDQAPGSVSNFVSLIRKGFYNNSAFMRVVPNFVVQVGCPRGDGTGGPGYSIRSELGPLYYEEGTLGMASSGKDTEGSQWFITHSPAPHLDGRYTIYGKVISGMKAVHKIEVGDKILGIELI